VAFLVDDPRDAGRRAVRVPAVVAEDDLVPLLEPCEQLLVGIPAALAVLDGDHKPLADAAARREERVRLLDPEGRVAATEPEGDVRQQGAREQSGFAKDLEAVADPEDR